MGIESRVSELEALVQNSKKVPNLALLSTLTGNESIAVYNPATQELEKTSVSNILQENKFRAEVVNSTLTVTQLKSFTNGFINVTNDINITLDDTYTNAFNVLIKVESGKKITINTASGATIDKPEINGVQTILLYKNNATNDFKTLTLYKQESRVSNVNVSAQTKAEAVTAFNNSFIGQISDPSSFYLKTTFVDALNGILTTQIYGLISKPSVGNQLQPNVYGLNGETIQDIHLELLKPEQQSTSQDIEEVANAVINLGDIGTTDIVTYINDTLSPDKTIANSATAITLIKSIQNGNQTDYIYIGSGGTYGANSTTNITLADLQLVEQESQEIGLRGSNYIYVYANGTDTENATELQNAYNFAKQQNPSSTNVWSVICGAGYYNFSSDFILDTEYINLVSLDSNRSVIFDGTGTIQANADNCRVVGVDVQSKVFEIGDDLPNLTCKNCISCVATQSLTNANEIQGKIINCLLDGKLINNLKDPIHKDLTATGAVNIDILTYKDAFLKLDGDITINFQNLPTSEIGYPIYTRLDYQGTARVVSLPVTSDPANTKIAGDTLGNDPNKIYGVTSIIHNVNGTIYMEHIVNKF